MKQPPIDLSHTHLISVMLDDAFDLCPGSHILKKTLSEQLREQANVASSNAVGSGCPCAG